MTPFHKVYVNPALGYWKDESKQEPLLLASFDLAPITFEEATKILQDHYKSVGVNLAKPDHLCLGSRCLICFAAQL